MLSCAPRNLSVDGMGDESSVASPDESPGLSLTRPQVMRLWSVDAEICDAVLERLMRTGYLRQTQEACT